MKAVIQRVTSAAVEVDGDVVGALNGPGLVVLLGVTHDDGDHQIATMARKIAELRIMPGEVSVADVEGAGVLIVSQFTLYGDTKKGRRPSWSAAAPGDVAEPMVDAVIAAVRAYGIRVETGRFGANMQVSLTNDGPFTLLVET